MIVVITAWFEIESGPYKGEKRLLADYGIDYDTMQGVVLPTEPPLSLGAIYNNELQEYVIY